MTFWFSLLLGSHGFAEESEEQVVITKKWPAKSRLMLDYSGSGDLFSRLVESVTWEKLLLIGQNAL
jgi:hypothetical protein